MPLETVASLFFITHDILFADYHHVGVTGAWSLDGQSRGIKDNLHTLDTVGQVAVGALRNIDTGTLTQLVEKDEYLLQQTLHITERLLTADDIPISVMKVSIPLNILTLSAAFFGR